MSALTKEHIAKSALLMYACSASRSDREAARLLGIDRMEFKRSVIEFNIITYFEEERREFEGTTEEGPKETISIKTKRGARDIEIGTEYFLGKVTDKSKGGKDVYRAPRLIVLGRNEDGTIKVQDSDGVIHDIKESTLERYNLGKVESTLKNKKAKFYMEHWNTIYEFNFGEKTGGKRKGRIEYDPEENKMLFVYNNIRHFYL